MREQLMQRLALGFTLLVHLGLICGITAANGAGDGQAHATAPSTDERTYIEAGLARKRTRAAGKPSRQPVKPVAAAPRPTDLAIARDPERTSEPKDAESQPVDPFAAQRDRYREVDTEDAAPMAPTTPDPGSDEESQEGADDGDARGTRLTTTGHPYEQALVTELDQAFVKAAFAQSGQADVCMRLRADGTIAKWEFATKDPRAAFNSAVEGALLQVKRDRATRAKDCDEDGNLCVPRELAYRLVRNDACVAFAN